MNEHLVTPFICPCCGYHASYSDELAMKVMQYVAEYYGTTAKHCLAKSSSVDRLEKKVRMIGAYFIREFTGVKFKTIGSFLGSHGSEVANRYHQQVEEIICGDESTVKCDIGKLEALLIHDLTAICG